MKKLIKSQGILAVLTVVLTFTALSCVGTIYPEDGSTPDSFSITASSGACATIAPSGVIPVPAGGSQAFSITPNPGQSIQDVWVDGVSVGVVFSFTFSAVSSNHTIVVVCPGEQILDLTIEGSGQVLLDPPGPTYPHGTVVTLNAVPDADWLFDRWEGDLVGPTNPVQLTMDRHKAVKAVFVPAQADKFTLHVYVNGGGSVGKSPDQPSYQQGSIVTVTATAQSGWIFDHWEGDLSGSQNPVQVTMDRNKVATAYFVPDQQDRFTLNLLVSGSGSITKYPDQSTFTAGTVVTVTAVPAAGWMFSRWEGDIVGTDTTVLVTMDANKTATAFFVEESQQYAVNVGVSGLGTVAKAPDQPAYDPGTVVTLTAMPQAGWKFDHWEGDLSGVQNPATILVDGPKAVTAYFIEEMYTLNVTVTGSGSVSKNPDRPSYSSGTVVALTATPQAGWEFDHWEGDLAGNANPGSLVMLANSNVTAVFIQPIEEVSILLVDDDDGGSYQTHYQNALQSNGFEFTLWTVSSQGSPSLATLQDHDIVVWHCSDQYSDTITADDQRNLESYLNCGGRLFLSGQDITWDHQDKMEFMTNYMGVGDWEFVGTDSLQGTNDEISSGLGTVSLSYPFTDHTDHLTPAAGATVSFNTDGGEPCGIKIARGKYRAVFFAFPFEAVGAANAQTAAALMYNVIGWLSEDMSNDDNPVDITFTYPTANEVVAGYVNVTVDTGGELCLSHVSYRVDGGQWVQVSDPPYSWFWDSREVANGMHTMEAQAFSSSGLPGAIASVYFEVDQEAVGPIAKYAVVAGISDYPGGGDLSYCDEDASDWYHYLVAHGYQVWVYGDGHENDYPKYDGLATVSNLRDAVRNVMSLADDNDIVVLSFSGHGAGSGGNSYYCAYDGNYDDNEVADDVATGNAGQVFVFFDSCFSGGMGDDLMDLNYNGAIYVSTTCGTNGYGYDEPAYQNGAWTHWFLNAGLTDHFNSTNVSMEENFTWADGQYNPGGGDEPREFDSDSSTPFHLDYPPAKNAWYPETDPEPVDLHTGESLADLLAGTARLELAYRDYQTLYQRSAPRTAMVREANRVAEIFQKLEPGQLLTTRAARCMFSYSLTFRDENGKSLGEIGLCYSEEYYQDHLAVFVAPDTDGHSVVRRGLTVPDTVGLLDLLDWQLAE